MEWNGIRLSHENLSESVVIITSHSIKPHHMLARLLGCLNFIIVADIVTLRARDIPEKQRAAGFYMCSAISGKFGARWGGKCEQRRCGIYLV